MITDNHKLILINECIIKSLEFISNMINSIQFKWFNLCYNITLFLFLFFSYSFNLQNYIDERYGMLMPVSKLPTTFYVIWYQEAYSKFMFFFQLKYQELKEYFNPNKRNRDQICIDCENL